MHLPCGHEAKSRNKKRLIHARKQLGREVQKFRRKQVDIEALNADNPREFWKEIGKIGIGAERQYQLPFEVINMDKEIITEQLVLNGENPFRIF